MARKSKNAKVQANLADQEPEPTATKDEGAGQNSGPKGRTPGGQFATGNAGGPGNPHARACARMLQAFRDNITEEEMLQICRMLFVKAVGGDITAAKIILSYKIGKPLPAPHPDSIDRDEWDHYQNDAVREDEMKLVLSSLPTHSGNDIARVSLPIMTAARMNEFAAQLLDGLPPKAEKGEGRGEKGEKTNAKESPIPNGKSDGKDVEKEECRGGKNVTKTPIANGKLDEKVRQSSANKQPRANGKSNANARQTSAKKQPIANGKKNGKAGRGSTIPTTPSATSPPAGQKREGKKMKKIRPAWIQPLAAQLQDN
jgi:hypothetical protein